MRVSVVVTCYNEAHFVEQAVRSIAAQSASERIGEIVVVDDASTDSSPEILRGLSREIPLVKVLRTTGLGLPGARNVGIGASSCELIALLDGDDYWDPEKLRLQLSAFDDARVGLVYSDYVDFTRRDVSDAQVISVRRYDAHMANTLADYFVHDAPIVPSTAIVRRQVFDDVGLFDPELRLGEDTEFFLRVALQWRFQHVPNALTYKRRHGANLTRRLDALLPAAHLLNRRAVEWAPSLKLLIPKRMARRYAAVGNDCGQKGEILNAVRYLSAALSADPLYGKTYLYACLALLPTSLGRDLRRRMKAVYHACRLRHA